MEYEITCSCGNVIPVSEEMAGTSIACKCGGAILAPALDALRAMAVSDVRTQIIPSFEPLESLAVERNVVEEIIAPTQAYLRSKRGDGSDSSAMVMAALTADALWIQDAWHLRSLALAGLEIERLRGGKLLMLAPSSADSGEALSLTFGSNAEGNRWHAEIQACQSKLITNTAHRTREVPEGVTLVQQAPDVPRVAPGRVSYAHGSAESADRGVQLRAGMLGADAVVDLKRVNCPEMGLAARQVAGVAVRVADGDDRRRLRWKWFAEEVSELTRRMLLLLAIQAALLFLVLTFITGKSTMIAATGETLAESIVSTGLGLIYVYAWPVALILALRLLRLRILILPVGIAVLAATTVRGLVVVLSHILAIITSGATLAESKILMIVDPVDWVFIILGAVYYLRTRRLAREASQILPPEGQVDFGQRKLWSRGVLAATGIYALILFGWSGIARYQESSYLLRKGVDPRREHEALLALNDGAAQASRGELDAAERSFQRALELWEKLNAKPETPSIYRANLALTLSNLGWIRLKQSRADEAENYYARAVAIADQIDRDPELDDESKRTLADARATLADLRRGKSDTFVEVKDKEAIRKYEDAEIRLAKEGFVAESLFRDAIAAWEEIVPKAVSEDNRKYLVNRLFSAYLRLGELQGQLDKRSESESSLKRAIDYGDKAVALDPTRTLNKHNLDVARKLLAELHEKTFADEINRLLNAERFADAIDAFRRAAKEQDDVVSSGKSLDTAVPSLAYRLNRFAWFLAHCPNRRFRDTKTAVEHAQRAAKLRPDVSNYWYTLAICQYRNGDWQNSMASLETMKARTGESDAFFWLVSAMNLHRLGRRDEARASVAKAVHWIEVTGQKAEENASLRLEYELMRPAIEELLQEVQALISPPSVRRKEA